MQCCPKISRHFRHLKDFTGLLGNKQTAKDKEIKQIKQTHLAEEVLVLMVICPVVFFGLLTDLIYKQLVGVAKSYLHLIYRVDKVIIDIFWVHWIMGEEMKGK